MLAPVVGGGGFRDTNISLSYLTPKGVRERDIVFGGLVAGHRCQPCGISSSSKPSSFRLGGIVKTTDHTPRNDEELPARYIIIYYYYPKG
jgi:hypothetical protein